MENPIWATTRLYHAGSEATPQTATRAAGACGSSLVPKLRFNFADVHAIKRYWQSRTAELDD
ncbi:hypothetical protein [Pseudomonas sp. AFG_SD02_1510_Pfu_092]|uniref:hypothetical protein n=1 Tax=Pseudomonas sp. AFG_SD02_1510_Pfu_092 TaxID=2259497 RepID=UPI0010586FB3|nr:hypothetical protein [Pseudomonas sp. AFG_SD02_1510_Pfu_092]